MILITQYFKFDFYFTDQVLLLLLRVSLYKYNDSLPVDYGLQVSKIRSLEICKLLRISRATFLTKDLLMPKGAFTEYYELRTYSFETLAQHSEL